MILEEINKDHQKSNNEELEIYTQRFLKKITENLEKFSYNKIIANLYEMYSFLSKEIKNPYKKEVIINSYQKILIAITPIIPHFANECLEKLEIKEMKWPEYDESKIREDIINIVIQFNGKKRGLIETELNITEKTLVEKIHKNEKLIKYLVNKKIKKIIYIKNKLINIII